VPAPSWKANAKTSSTPPRNQTELTGRVIAALAEKAAATADNANDRPVLVDLGQTPADPGASAEPAEPAPAPASHPPAQMGTGPGAGARTRAGPPVRA
jgi:hypothetical protein